VSFAKKIVVTHCARAVYTARVSVHGTYTAVYTARTRPCTRPVHGRVHIRVHTHTCRPPLQGRVRAIYTAVYTASTQPYTRAMYTTRTVSKCSCTHAVYGPCTRPVVYMAGRPTGPCTRSQTARCGRVRPVTTVHTARSQPVHGRVDGRFRPCRWPVHGQHVYAAVYVPCTRPCARPVHGRVHGRKQPCTRPVHCRVHVTYLHNIS